MSIRPAELADLDAVQAIYAVEVLEGTATFETTPPDRHEIERRYSEVRAAGLPYLVAVPDGATAGYAYAHPYRSRPSYRLSVETSIYVARGYQGRGLGLALLGALMENCLAAGKRQMIAIIGDSANQGSIRVHEKAGFRHVGTLTNVGYKFERFLDTVIMQRSLGDDRSTG